MLFVAMGTGRERNNKNIKKLVSAIFEETKPMDAYVPKLPSSLLFTGA